MTDEEKQLHRKHVSEALFRRYEDPEERRKLKERAQGENNPMFNRKWMTNGKDRVPVKKEDIQKYIERGFYFKDPKMNEKYAIFRS